MTTMASEPQHYGFLRPIVCDGCGAKIPAVISHITSGIYCNVDCFKRAQVGKRKVDTQPVQAEDAAQGVVPRMGPLGQVEHSQQLGPAEPVRGAHAGHGGTPDELGWVLGRW